MTSLKQNEVSCQCCGKPVMVHDGYYGCITCDKCRELQEKYPSQWTNDTNLEWG